MAVMGYHLQEYMAAMGYYVQICISTPFFNTPLYDKAKTISWIFDFFLWNKYLEMFTSNYRWKEIKV